ncbi:MAG: hypothetical protein IKF71_04760 [Bacilli bacterium]|nr:hypothetical protein [Bacilli bacterium]
MKKKKSNKLLFTLVAVFLMITSLFVYAESNEEIKTVYVNCDITSVTMGDTLNTYSVTNKTKGLSIDKTKWAYKEKEGDKWSTFTNGNEITNGDYHYALYIEVTADEGYFLPKTPTIYFNGYEYNIGYTGFEQLDSGASGYLYIDLGTPEPANTEDPDPGEPENPSDPEEPTVYTITYDFNGGTYDGDGVLPETIQEGQDLSLSTLVLSRGYLLPPKLKALDGFKINGEDYETDEVFENVHSNITVKYIWKSVESQSYTVSDDTFGATINFTEEKGVNSFRFYMDSMSHLLATEDVSEESQEFYLDMVDKLKLQAQKTGTYIDFYIFELRGKLTEEANYYGYYEGPFDVKIEIDKLETKEINKEQLKKFKKFKMIYVDYEDDDDDNPVLTDETYDFTVNGDYIEGKVDHFSEYVLVGIDEPATGDHVVLYFIIGLLSVVGIVSVRKLKKN